MWIITYKNKIVNVEKLYKVEGRAPSWHVTEETLGSVIAAKTKLDVIALYLERFGYTWKERTKGIEATRVTIEVR